MWGRGNWVFASILIIKAVEAVGAPSSWSSFVAPHAPFLALVSARVGDSTRTKAVSRGTRALVAVDVREWAVGARSVVSSCAPLASPAPWQLQSRLHSLAFSGAAQNGKAGLWPMLGGRFASADRKVAGVQAALGGNAGWNLGMVGGGAGTARMLRSTVALRQFRLSGGGSPSEEGEGPKKKPLPDYGTMGGVKKRTKVRSRDRFGAARGCRVLAPATRFLLLSQLGSGTHGSLTPEGFSIDLAPLLRGASGTMASSVSFDLVSPIW